MPQFQGSLGPFTDLEKSRTPGPAGHEKNDAAAVVSTLSTQGLPTPPSNLRAMRPLAYMLLGSALLVIALAGAWKYL